MFRKQGKRTRAPQWSRGPVPLRNTKDGAVATFAFDNGAANSLTPVMHKELHDSLRNLLASRRPAGEEVRLPTTVGRTGTRASGLDPVAWDREAFNIERFEPVIGVGVGRESADPGERLQLLYHKRMITRMGM